MGSLKLSRIYKESSNSVIEPRDEDGKLTQNFKKMCNFAFSGMGLAVSFTALGSTLKESVMEHRIVPVFFRRLVNLKNEYESKKVPSQKHNIRS